MEPTDINYLAVLVAGIAYFILGAIWYSPALFGNAWMKAIGKTKEQAQADYSPWKLLFTLIMALVAAYGIARISSWIRADLLWSGLGVGLLIGVCFVLTTMGMNDLMESRPKKLFLMNIFYQIISFMVMGLIIGLWR